MANYTYENATNWLTSLAYGNGDVVEYTYDNQGRVTKQTYEDGTYVTFKYDNSSALARVYDSQSYITTSYEYDTANQLRRENNQAAGKTWIWGYDKAGNILHRREYAYTTGSVGEVLDWVTYTYGDSNWGDKLTAYDGQTITYDEIGNTLSDGNWTYTWQHGRELLYMEKDSAVTITKQPEDHVYTPAVLPGLPWQHPARD